MTDKTQAVEQPITTREWIRGILVVVVLTTAAVGLGIWLLGTFVFGCGCTTPA
jgi:hypothetical protein